MGIEHYCPTCFGQGVITSMDIIPGGTCPTCKGKGFITSHEFKKIQDKKDDGDEKLEDSREGSS